MEKSAGILCFKQDKDNIYFFIVHAGGPCNIKKNIWGIPKGHVENDENAFEAAIREFNEETGIKLPSDEKLFLDLGEKKQNKKKIIHIFAIKWDNFDINDCKSNTCEIEYPYGSGKKIIIPEIDAYKWETFDNIKNKLIKGQIPFFNEILNIINND